MIDKAYIVGLCLLTQTVWAQTDSSFLPPLDIPPAISGSFAELRSHHFHSGIDYKTQGREGLPVRAVKEGYVSRIRVSASGFGNALYLDHPGGKTSVYAHLQRFNPEIQAYLRKAQYAQKQSEVDLFPKPGELSVSKGDTLGLSGNSGSSMGPHLHFELRDTRSEHPLNPLKSGFDSPDTRKPELRKLALVGLDSDFRETSRREWILTKKPADTLKIVSGLNPGGYGIELDAIDRLDLSENANGLHRLVLTAGGTERYRFEADRFSFDETRQIDALINYARKTSSGMVWHRLYRLPGSTLSLSLSDSRRGRIWLHAGDTVNCTIVATDAAGNVSQASLVLIGHTDEISELPSADSTAIDPAREERISFGTHRAIIPKNALYRRESRSIDPSAVYPGTYGSCVRLLSPDIALKKSIELDFDLSVIPEKYRARATAVRFSASGTPTSIGGKTVSGRLVAESKELGGFGLKVDSIAPRVSLNVPGSKPRLEEKNRLRFAVSDDFSGIERYDLYIDGSWEVLDYDVKNAWMDHRFEGEPTGADRHYRVEISDRCGNKSVLEGVFRW